MDLNLNFATPTDHLGLNDEVRIISRLFQTVQPVQSTLTMQDGKLMHLCTGMAYGSKMREYEYVKDPEEQLIITEKLVEAGIIGKRFLKRDE